MRGMGMHIEIDPTIGEKMRADNGPFRRELSALTRAVREMRREGRPVGKNKITERVVFHASELTDIEDDILAGRRDQWGYEIS